jgi:hypothetical protein
MFDKAVTAGLKRHNIRRYPILFRQTQATAIARAGPLGHLDGAVIPRQRNRPYRAIRHYCREISGAARDPTLIIRYDRESPTKEVE